jgi:hypothetical protein
LRKRKLRLGLLGGTALRAVAANFEPGDHNMEAAISLNLALESIEQIAFKFGNLAASQAGHVNVIALGAAFVKVFLSLHVHQVEFIDQSVAFQQSKSAINRHPVNLRIDAPGATK